MLYTMTKDMIATGTAGVGQDYLGAVKGAMSIIDDLCYPVCQTMTANGTSNYDPWYDERLWYFPPTEPERDAGYYAYYDEDGYLAYGNRYFDTYWGHLDSGSSSLSSEGSGDEVYKLGYTDS